jgi:hypothetical protein
VLSTVQRTIQHGETREQVTLLNELKSSSHKILISFWKIFSLKWEEKIHQRFSISSPWNLWEHWY